MKTHDPKCPSLTHPKWGQCHCDLIAEVRAEEQEKKMAAADIAFLDAVQARERLAAIEAQIEALQPPLYTSPLSTNAYTFAIGEVLAIFRGGQP